MISSIGSINGVLLGMWSNTASFVPSFKLFLTRSTIYKQKYVFINYRGAKIVIVTYIFVPTTTNALFANQWHPCEQNNHIIILYTMIIIICAWLKKIMTNTDKCSNSNKFRYGLYHLIQNLARQKWWSSQSYEK